MTPIPPDECHTVIVDRYGPPQPCRCGRTSERYGVIYRHMARCGTCSGSGIIRLPCNGCGGTGRGGDGKTCMACRGDRQVTVRCTVCKGSGRT